MKDKIKETADYLKQLQDVFDDDTEYALWVRTWLKLAILEIYSFLLSEEE